MDYIGYPVGLIDEDYIQGNKGVLHPEIALIVIGEYEQHPLVFPKLRTVHQSQGELLLIPGYLGVEAELALIGGEGYLDMLIRLVFSFRTRKGYICEY